MCRAPFTPCRSRSESDDPPLDHPSHKLVGFRVFKPIAEAPGFPPVPPGWGSVRGRPKRITRALATPTVFGGSSQRSRIWIDGSATTRLPCEKVLHARRRAQRRHHSQNKRGRARACVCVCCYQSTSQHAEARPLDSSAGRPKRAGWHCKSLVRVAGREAAGGGIMKKGWQGGRRRAAHEDECKSKKI